MICISPRLCLFFDSKLNQLYKNVDNCFYKLPIKIEHKFSYDIVFMTSEKTKRKLKSICKQVNEFKEVERIQKEQAGLSASKVTQ